MTRYIARTFPEEPPKVPAFDFAHRRLVLVAAGPRSSTGYGVRIVRITERRSTIDVLAQGGHAVTRRAASSRGSPRRTA